MAKTQYRYEYGQRWDARIPRNAVAFLINRLHVSATTAEVEKLIRDRCAKSEGFTPRLTAQAVAYALAVHDANCRLYQYVMRGRP